MKEIYELLEQKEQVKALIKAIEDQIRELNELLEYVKSREGKFYILKGNVFIEAKKEEVIKDLEDKIKLLELQRERYNKRLELINEKIKQLRNR